MCGRNSVFLPQPEIEQRFSANVAEGVQYRPRFNIAPGAVLEVITNEDPGEIDQYRWGLVPHWMDEPGEGLINARSETAHEKPSFRSAWENRPCLVLSTGFYEWKQANGGPKQPYRIYREDDPGFAMAGLWEEWEGEDERLRTVTILTTEPNTTVKPIHDRMPVVLPQDSEEDWLTLSPEERKELCRPYQGEDLDAYEVSTRVNNPENNDARVIEPLGTDQSDLGEFA